MELIRINCFDQGCIFCINQCNRVKFIFDISHETLISLRTIVLHYVCHSEKDSSVISLFVNVSITKLCTETVHANCALSGCEYHIISACDDIS